MLILPSGKLYWCIISSVRIKLMWPFSNCKEINDCRRGRNHLSQQVESLASTGDIAYWLILYQNFNSFSSVIFLTSLCLNSNVFPFFFPPSATLLAAIENISIYSLKYCTEHKAKETAFYNLIQWEMLEVLSHLPLCITQTYKSQSSPPKEFVELHGDLRKAWYLSPTLKDCHK